MATNLDRYQNDLDQLIRRGDELHTAIQYECYPVEIRKQIEDEFKDKAKANACLERIPSFQSSYQSWYSESKALIRQLLPDRLEDFVRHYEKPKVRKGITYENYRIEDNLQGLNVTRGYHKEKVVGPDAAIPHFRQQLSIVKAARNRFKSSLFEIRQLVQADLFDSEIEAAKELAKKKFLRAAGAIAGVVLEKHLSQVSNNHQVKVGKKDPNIGDLNDALKQAQVYDTAQWRFIQHLGDLRNLCDHNKIKEPTIEQVADLVDGVDKVMKTVF